MECVFFFMSPPSGVIQYHTYPIGRCIRTYARDANPKVKQQMNLFFSAKFPPVGFCFPCVMRQNSLAMSKISPQPLPLWLHLSEYVIFSAVHRITPRTIARTRLPGTSSYSAAFHLWLLHSFVKRSVRRSFGGM